MEGRREKINFMSQIKNSLSMQDFPDASFLKKKIFFFRFNILNLGSPQVRSDGSSDLMARPQAGVAWSKRSQREG